MKPLDTKHHLITPNPCRINNRIARELILDGKSSQYPFECNGEYLVVFEVDKHLLTDEEQGLLVEQIEKENDNL